MTESLPIRNDLDNEIEEKAMDLKGELYLAVSQMKREIFERPYTLVIGDDASGRLAALAISEFMKIIYTKNNLPNPNTRFFKGSGGRLLELAERAARVGDIKRELSSALGDSARILVVTDTMENGLGVSALTEAIKELGISFDILTADININDDEGAINKEEVSQKVGALKNTTGAANIFYGAIGTSSLSREYAMHGVISDRGSAIHSPLTIDYAKSEDGRKTIRYAIEESRKHAHAIAQYLARELGDKIKFEYDSETDI